MLPNFSNFLVTNRVEDHLERYNYHLFAQKYQRLLYLESAIEKMIEKDRELLFISDSSNLEDPQKNFRSSL